MHRLVLGLFFWTLEGLRELEMPGEALQCPSPGLVAHTYSPRTQEVEVEGILKANGQRKKEGRGEKAWVFVLAG